MLVYILKESLIDRDRVVVVEVRERELSFQIIEVKVFAYFVLPVQVLNPTPSFIQRLSMLNRNISSLCRPETSKLSVIEMQNVFLIT